jgi:hypothetical protein
MARTSPRRSSIGTAIGGAVVLGIVLAACSAAGGSTAPSQAGASALAASPAIASPTPATRTASPPPSPLPSPLVSSSSADLPAAPPVASLAVEGGDPVAGKLGSYIWAGGGSDSPWLPGAPIRVGSGERLRLSLAPATGIQSWTATRVKSGTTDGSGAVAVGSGTKGPVAFDAPPPGHWSVEVTLRFADDLGSATYYWRFDVS